MGQAEAPDRVLWAIPPEARDAWLELRSGLEERGTVACRKCPLRRPCAQYALVAAERFGVWGATLPEERRTARLVAAGTFGGRHGFPPGTRHRRREAAWPPE